MVETCQLFLSKINHVPASYQVDHRILNVDNIYTRYDIMCRTRLPGGLVRAGDEDMSNSFTRHSQLTLKGGFRYEMPVQMKGCPLTR